MILKNNFSGNRLIFYDNNESSNLLSNFFSRNKILNRTSVLDFLMFGSILPPNSPINGINLMFPGEKIDFKNLNKNYCSYSKLNLKVKKISIDQFVNEVDFLFSIYFNKFKNKNNTLLLSGGIDSAIILSYLGKNTNCITWGGHGYNSTDIIYSKETAKAFGIKNHSFVLANHKEDLKLYKDAVRTLKIPLYYLNCVPHIKMAIEAKKNSAKSIFMGQNADTVFMSYATSVMVKRLAKINKFLPFNPLIFSKSRRKYLFSTNDIIKLFAYYKSNGIFPGSWINVDEKYFKDKNNVINKYLKFNNFSQKIILIEEFLTEARRNQVYQNEIPAIFNIDVQCPYYEKKFIELMLRVPNNIRSMNGYNKIILKKLAKKRGVPDSVINHPKKGLSYSYKNFFDKNLHISAWDKMQADDFINSFINIKKIRRINENNFLVFDILRSLYFWGNLVVKPNNIKYK